MVTSIREPYARWMSVYLFNRQLQGNHYGIPWNISFAEFAERFNPCSLFKYYERSDVPCNLEDTDEEITERVMKIVRVFDDVIELSAEPESDLHRRIAPYVGNQYVSERKGDEPDKKMINAVNMRHESILYRELQKLKARRPEPHRTLCRHFEPDPNFRSQLD